MNNIFSLQRLSLRKRLTVLVLVPIVLTLILGVIAFRALDNNKNTLNDITAKADMLLLAHNLLTNIHSKIRAPILNLENGKLTWSDGLQILSNSRQSLTEQFELFNHYSQIITLREGDLSAVAAKAAMPVFESAFDDVITIVKTENHNHLKLFVKEEMHERMNPLVKAVTTQQREVLKLTNEEITNTLSVTTKDGNIILGLLAATLLLLILLGTLVFRSIATQTKSLISTISALNEGDKNVRTDIKGKHELALLGTALNQLLDERDKSEQHIQQENERLNDSVFALLESVADLSERNLTVRATVTEDVTGPLADAINQLAIDTSNVLKKVRKIALNVENTSQTVDLHTSTVKDLAALERAEAEQTTEAINYLIERLNQIAQSSVAANNIANATTQATEKAYQSVSKTVDSMTEIRDTVQETGKRIKRLGERSQEITHIIDLINTITERTTLLALNASMQALSAGEAGKEFSVIAEEIQRLAEGSREATDQITHLVNNIQQETRTTMATMDNTIEQVVVGTSLAEQASEQMQLTLNATNKLTHSVEVIAQASKEQASISNKLRLRTSEILRTTEATGREMGLLNDLTKGMVLDTQTLVQSVSVFKLENKTDQKVLPRTSSHSPKIKQLVSNG